MGKKGLIVVSFGTSIKETREKTIGAIERELQESFPEHVFFRAWTSGMIIRKLKAQGEDILNVEEALNRALEEGVTELLVQPTHIIPGREYRDVKELLGHFTDKFDKILFGDPLLNGEEGCREAADLLAALFPVKDGECMIFMGHGTGDADNTPYHQVIRFLQEQDPRLLMGLVEAKPDISEVIQQVNELSGIRKAVLSPFMVVAGDHALNDMDDLH